jgi:hypothetical protein
MRKVCLTCIYGLLFVSSAFTQPANHADLVLAYEPGTDPGALTSAAAILGEPSRQTEDPQWGTFPVDPFSPPYLASQLVALGDGGSLVVRLEQPILDDPGNPHGLDFLVFGNAFFQLNGDWTTTSGSLGGTNAGTTLVSVSHDGITYYTLAPELAPPPDSWFPTDHAGAPNRPMNPALTVADFAGRDLEGIRELYAGSAGGTGYDLAWAREPDGKVVKLPFARYVRFDQERGAAQLDALSAVAPPPAIFADFETDPQHQGWNAFGEGSLFRWDPDAGNLHVSWDSSRTNSYFHRPLGITLTRQDDFTLSFDLRLASVAIGVDSAKPFTFQLAVGLIQLATATNRELWRASGVDVLHGPRNLVEFAYFPDSGFGATISPSIISSNTQFASQFDFPIELATDTTFNVLLRYTASDQTLRTSLSRSHADFATIQDVVLPAEFTDFTVDAVAICSYSDVGQDPRFGGSILAEGTIDNILVQLPPPPLDDLVGFITPEGYHVTFNGQGGWTYTLERSLDLTAWTDGDTHSSIQSGPVMLEDLSPPPARAFYRVGARR